MRPALRLYVHIPYCLRRCPYCDFNAHARKNPDWAGLEAALLAEMEAVAERHGLAGRRLASVFFGGGTPSLAPAALIAAVLDKAARLFGIAPRAEITLEANPGTLTETHLRALRAAGINRLSLGVQSLSDAGLRVLGRWHDAEDARRAVAAARRAGFANLSLDLIYGWPGQTLADWAGDLARAVRLGPEHMSCYELTIEPGTPFAARGVRAADEETALAMWRLARAYLADRGYEAYEISNYARPGMRARHNEGYWRYDDYLGIGPGAASKLDLPDGGVLRWTNLRHPERYAARARAGGCVVAEQERLAREEAAREALWLGLRRKEGVPAAPFRRRFGCPPRALVQGRMQRWLASGYLCSDAHGGLRLREEGMALLDAIMSS